MLLERAEEETRAIHAEGRKGDRVRAWKNTSHSRVRMRGGLSPSWRCYCHIIIKRRSLAMFLESERHIHRKGERERGAGAKISLHKLWISLFMNA